MSKVGIVIRRLYTHDLFIEEFSSLVCSSSDSICTGSEYLSWSRIRLLRLCPLRRLLGFIYGLDLILATKPGWSHDEYISSIYRSLWLVHYRSSNLESTALVDSCLLCVVVFMYLILVCVGLSRPTIAIVLRPTSWLYNDYLLISILVDIPFDILFDILFFGYSPSLLVSEQT